MLLLASPQTLRRQHLLKASINKQLQMLLELQSKCGRAHEAAEVPAECPAGTAQGLAGDLNDAQGGRASWLQQQTLQEDQDLSAYTQLCAQLPVALQQQLWQLEDAAAAAAGAPQGITSWDAAASAVAAAAAGSDRAPGLDSYSIQTDFTTASAAAAAARPRNLPKGPSPVGFSKQSMLHAAKQQQRIPAAAATAAEDAAGLMDSCPSHQPANHGRHGSYPAAAAAAAAADVNTSSIPAALAGSTEGPHHQHGAGPSRRCQQQQQRRRRRADGASDDSAAEEEEDSEDFELSEVLLR
jgi:hypothetical protein